MPLRVVTSVILNRRKYKKRTYELAYSFIYMSMETSIQPITAKSGPKKVSALPGQTMGMSQWPTSIELQE